MFACVTIPNFCWQVEANRCPDLREQGAIILDRPQNSSTPAVLDWSPALKHMKAGMPLSHALSHNREAMLIQPDLPAYQRAFEQLLDDIQERIPDVEAGELGTAYVRLTGVERMYGDDANALRAIGDTLGDYDARIGLGENKWLAYVAALHSRHGSARKITGDPGRYLSRLPVSILPVDYRTVDRLRSYGLKTLGDIADIEPGPMQAQFGPIGLRMSERSSGIDHSHFVPRQPRLTVSEYVEFEDATASLEAIMAHVESMLAKVFQRHEVRGRYAREALLEGRVLHQGPWMMPVVFKDPAGTPSQASLAIRTKLNDLRLPGPLEDIRLTLSGITGEFSRQQHL